MTSLLTNAVFLLIRKGTTTKVRTDATGHYRVRLAPGRYTVSKGNWGPGGIKPSSVSSPRGASPT